MGKVSIKKNVKPKTIKQKQRQTQKTSVTVNIGSISKKRGRPTKKRQQLEKKPTQQPVSQPSIISYNQPIFKQQPTQQPTSLASSILATQASPAIIKKEEIQQSSLQKALGEQNTQTDEPVTRANDLERVRDARVKKLDKKEEVKADESVRSGLFSQILSDKQNDTEEIKLLQPISTQTDIPFVTDSSTQTPGDISLFPAVVTGRELRLLNRPPTEDEKSILNKNLGRTLLDLRKEKQQKAQSELLQFRQDAEESTQAEEPSLQPEDIQPETIQEESPLKQEYVVGASKLVTETVSEPTPLSQITTLPEVSSDQEKQILEKWTDMLDGEEFPDDYIEGDKIETYNTYEKLLEGIHKYGYPEWKPKKETIELGFGGLSEEPIQTSVGQFLPPEPVSSTVLEVKTKKKAKTLLTPLVTIPSILQAQEVAPSILQGQPYVTETLVKGEEIPEAQVGEIPAEQKTGSEQALELFRRLKKEGKITVSSKKPNKSGNGTTAKTISELTNDIRNVTGYETWQPVQTIERKGRPKNIDI